MAKARTMDGGQLLESGKFAGAGNFASIARAEGAPDENFNIVGDEVDRGIAAHQVDSPTVVTGGGGGSAECVHLGVQLTAVGARATAGVGSEDVIVAGGVIVSFHPVAAAA